MNTMIENNVKLDLTIGILTYNSPKTLKNSLITYLNAGYTTRGLILFGSQLAINLMWSGLFFGRRLICGSLLNVIVMNILVFFTYVEFKKSSLFAANLLLPYMIWILLAAYLNLYICINN